MKSNLIPTKDIQQDVVMQRIVEVLIVESTVEQRIYEKQKTAHRPYCCLASLLKHRELY